MMIDFITSPKSIGGCRNCMYSTYTPQKACIHACEIARVPEDTISKKEKLETYVDNRMLLAKL